MVRLSTVILPLARWPESKEKWRRAEELGFFAAYTYDVLSIPRFRDGPWFASVPVLSAAALETSSMRLGTLVTSPNYRHPVPLAKDLLTIDDLSNGRLTVGIGAGAADLDASVLGNRPWSAVERMNRFVNFVDLLDKLLTEPVTNSDGPFYSAVEARMLPGPLQQPRPPLYIAANGTRGFELAARHGQGWLSLGKYEKRPGSSWDTVASQLQRLGASLDRRGRSRDSIDKILLDGFTEERPLASVDAFVDWAGRYAGLGMTELVLHWPEQGTRFESDARIFERIATDGISQLQKH